MTETGYGPASLSLLLLSSAFLWLPAVAWLAWLGWTKLAIAGALLPLAWGAPWYRRWRILLAPVAICALFPVMAQGFLAAFAGRPLEWKGRTA
jgi:hypothetical protein